MNRILLLFTFLFLSASLNAQRQTNVLNQSPVSNGISKEKLSEIKSNYYLDELQKGSKAMVAFEKVSEYEGNDGTKYPLSPNQIVVQFKDGVSISQMNSILSNYSEFDEIVPEQIGNRNLVTVTFKSIPGFNNLKNAIEDLSDHSKIKYAHYMYVAEEGYPIGATDGVLVKLRSSGDVPTLQSRLQRFGGKLNIKQSFPKLNLYRVEASKSSNYNSIELSNRLRETKLFKYVEPDLFVRPKYLNTNDPLVGTQWGLNNDGSNTSTWGGTTGIDARVFDAWGIANGSGVKIAVLDSGVDLTHEDLVDHLADGYSTPGTTTTGGNHSGSGHGTACAGIAAAVGDNGIGVAGVAYNATIIPVNLDVTSIADIVTLWMWVIEDAKADITTNSYSYPGGPFASVTDVINFSYTDGRGGLGMLNFFATGNDNGAISWPASEESDAVVAVGAMNMCGERKSPSSCDNETIWGSNFGSQIDLVAPSPKIQTTDITGSGGYASGEYEAAFNGTSAATPFAGGVASLVLSANPLLTGAELRTLLETTCSKYGNYDYQDVAGHPNGTWHQEVGHGMINAYAAASIAAAGPVLIIDPTSQNRTVIEAEGCATYTDYELMVTILGDYTGTDNPTATVEVTGGTVVAADYAWQGSNTVTFTGGTAQSQMVTLRIFNELEVEGEETIEFTVSLDAGNTDVVLSDNDNFKSTTWTIEDAVLQEEKPMVSFIDFMDDSEVECLGSGELTLDITFDRFASETSWDVKDLSGNVIASNSYTSSANETTITETITVPDNNTYVFTIYDSFGDGICCAYGDGTYALKDADGNVLGTGGDFEDSESTEFCVGRPYVEQPVQIGVNSIVAEEVNCGEDYTDYFLEVMINNCVFGEQDVMATLVVGDATATEGEDFEFLSGKTVTFNGEGEQKLPITFRVYSDGIVESTEYFDFSLEVDVPDLVDVSETLGSGRVTINDSDSPELVVEPMGDSIYESDYNCTDMSNTYMFEVSVEGCAEIDGDLVLQVSQAASSVAIAGEDFNILTPTVTFNSANADETQVVEIEVINDYMEEGDELMELEFTVDGVAGLNMSALSVTIKDAMGNAAPSVMNKIFEDFESGEFSADWSILNFPGDDIPNRMTISGNTGLNNLAAHITNSDDNAFEYSSHAPFNDIFLISPKFNLEGSDLMDFMFQVRGEAGFGIYDFAVVGLVPGDVDITDRNALVVALNAGNLDIMVNVPDPTSYTGFLGVPSFNASTLNPALVGTESRLVFVWENDFSIDNDPPLALDDIKIQNGNFIERDVMFGEERPQYPIAEGENTYYYNNVDKDIAMSVKSSSDHGCSSGYVAEAGNGVLEFISPYSEDYRAAKSFVLEAGTADTEATTEVSLYYTEEEVLGWETETGRDRSEIQMFKAMGTKLIGCCGEVVLNLTLDNFPQETSWEIKNSAGAVVANSGGTYAGQEDGATVVETIQLNDGDYTFSLLDSFGDGICCTFGNGSYSLTLNGEEIASGGEFDDADSTEFTIGDGAIEFCQDYRMIDYAPVSLTPYLNGYKVTASFATGFDTVNSFGLSALPKVTPGEFTAVQEQEQVNIKFVDKHPSGEVDYIIFEEQGEDLEWIELETVPVSSTGEYEVVDYHPHNGINRYRVTYVLSNGDKITPCYEAEVFYEPTNDFHVTPNPARDDITLIISDGNISGPMAISIYDERGRLVMSDDIVSMSGVTRYSVDISHLGTGQYYIKLLTGNGYERDATFVKVAN